MFTNHVKELMVSRAWGHSVWKHREVDGDWRWWYFLLGTSLKLTWHLKMDGWKTSFLLGWPIFRCYVSFREGSKNLQVAPVSCTSPRMETMSRWPVESRDP